MVGTTGPKENWPIAVMEHPDGNIEAYFEANWLVNVVVEPRQGGIVGRNIGIDQPGFLWLLHAARDYLKGRQLPNPTLTPQTQGEPMTAKSIVTKNTPPPTRTYPWVGINEIGVVVWFTSPVFGIVVGRDPEGKTFAPNLGSTVVAWNVGDFKEFTGTVTISN